MKEYSDHFVLLVFLSVCFQSSCLIVGLRHLSPSNRSRLESAKSLAFLEIQSRGIVCYCRIVASAIPQTAFCVFARSS